jgi:hypothetical protein
VFTVSVMDLVEDWVLLTHAFTPAALLNLGRFVG